MTFCGSSYTDPLGNTQVIPVPKFSVSSTPTGAEAFITLDQSKGTFEVRPLAAHAGIYSAIRITMDVPADWLEFKLTVPMPAIDCKNVPAHANQAEI